MSSSEENSSVWRWIVTASIVAGLLTSLLVVVDALQGSLGSAYLLLPSIAFGFACLLFGLLLLANMAKTRIIRKVSAWSALLLGTFAIGALIVSFAPIRV